MTLTRVQIIEENTCRVVQFITGVTFVFAAFVKLAPLEYVQPLLIKPSFLTSHYALGFWGYVALCDWEFIVGVGLIAFPSSKVAVRAAMVTQVLFIAALVYMLVVGQRNCGCMGAGVNIHPVIPLFADLVSFACLWRLNMRSIEMTRTLQE